MRTRCIKFKCDRCGYEKIYELDENGEIVDIEQIDKPFHIFSLADGTHLCDECEQKRKKLMDWFMKGDKRND